MGMPNNLILVRHGQSEGNIATEAAKQGDLQFYTDKFTTTPGHQWRLTEKGQIQASTIGAWVAEEFSHFDEYYVSPFVRTRETAGYMALPSAQWLRNRALRERDWGDIGALPWATFKEKYPDNYWMQQNDPLYWAPPGGESIAHVAENRVRNVLSTMHRENDGQNVIAVTHGELMWSFRLVLERWDDEEFVIMDKDKSQKIYNCTAIHYTRLNPFDPTAKPEKKLTWMRRAWPVLVDEMWRIEVSEWKRIGRTTMSNEELLASVDKVPALFR